jgi:hypothetical protein
MNFSCIFMKCMNCRKKCHYFGNTSLATLRIRNVKIIVNKKNLTAVLPKDKTKPYFFFIKLRKMLGKMTIIPCKIILCKMNFFFYDQGSESSSTVSSLLVNLWINNCRRIVHRFSKIVHRFLSIVHRFSRIMRFIRIFHEF